MLESNDEDHNEEDISFPAAPFTVLGFDFGTKSIGVAVGQSITQKASPLTCINVKRIPQDWFQIKPLIDAWKPALLVIGLPLNMDSSESPLCEQVKQFRDALKQFFDDPIHLVDERLTTRAVHWDQEDVKTKKNRSHNKDALAAAIITESWFEDNL